MIVIPAVERGNFEAVASSAADAPNASYALGHTPDLRAAGEGRIWWRCALRVEAAMRDPKFRRDRRDRARLTSSPCCANRPCATSRSASSASSCASRANSNCRC
jgi:hypothetical protein